MNQRDLLLLLCYEKAGGVGGGHINISAESPQCPKPKSPKPLESLEARKHHYDNQFATCIFARTLYTSQLSIPCQQRKSRACSATLILAPQENQNILGQLHWSLKVPKSWSLRRQWPSNKERKKW